MKLRILIFIFFLFTFKQTLAIEFEELKTNKGITFWFIKDTSLPLVSLSFSFRGGSFLDPKNKTALKQIKRLENKQIDSSSDSLKEYCTQKIY